MDADHHTRRGPMVEEHTLDYIDSGVYQNGHRVSDNFTLRGSNADCVTATCTARYAYDSRDRLANYLNGHGERIAYEFDQNQSGVQSEIKASNLTAERHFSGATSLSSGTPNTGATKTMTYEGTQMKTLVQGAQTTKHFYDDFGRRDCITTGAGDEPDCLTADTGSTSPALLATYEYDQLDRLELFRAFSGGEETDSTTYIHDPLDRVAKEIENHDLDTSARTRVTTFAYQGLTGLEVTESAVTDEGLATETTRAKTFSYDAAGNRLSMTNAKDGAAPETYGFSHDVNGSTSALIDLAGSTSVEATYGYDPYGEEDPDLSSGDPLPEDNPDAEQPEDLLNPFRYSGRRFDTGSDSYDMGARRYGSDFSGFLQRDMYFGALNDLSLTTDALTGNRYGLAGGNPISFVEWDGHYVVGGADGSAAPAKYQYSGGRDGGGGSTAAPSFPEADRLASSRGSSGGGGTAGGRTRSSLAIKTQNEVESFPVLSPDQDITARLINPAPVGRGPVREIFPVNVLGPIQDIMSLADRGPEVETIPTFGPGGDILINNAPNPDEALGILIDAANDEAESASSTDDEGGEEESEGGVGESVDDVLGELPKGRQSNVRTIGSEEELESTFQRLTLGGSPIVWDDYKGPVIRRPDGVEVGLRAGWAIDIRRQDGTIRKIHIQ